VTNAMILTAENVLFVRTAKTPSSIMDCRRYVRVNRSDISVNEKCCMQVKHEY